MDETLRSLLLIVEGEKEEPRLIEALFKAFNPEVTWQVYPYRTVIHDLIQKIVSHYDGDYDNIDIKKALTDMLPDNEVVKRDMLLNTTFTDVILMFDFDPQDNRMDADELRKMMVPFDDSSDTDRVSF